MLWNLLLTSLRLFQKACRANFSHSLDRGSSAPAVKAEEGKKTKIVLFIVVFKEKVTNYHR